MMMARALLLSSVLLHFFLALRRVRYASCLSRPPPAHNHYGSGSGGLP